MPKSFYCNKKLFNEWLNRSADHVSSLPTKEKKEKKQGNEKLKEISVAAAKRIGKVEIDYGETSFKTPDAIQRLTDKKLQKSCNNLCVIL